MFIGTVAIPRLDRREDRLEPLRTIRHEEAHSVARLPAQGRQCLREAANPVGRLPERHHSLRIDPGRAVWVPFGSASQEVAGIHWIISSSITVDNIEDITSVGAYKSRTISGVLT